MKKKTCVFLLWVETMRVAVRLLLAALPCAVLILLYWAMGERGAFLFGVTPRSTRNSLWWLMWWPMCHFSWPHVLKNALVLFAGLLWHVEQPYVAAALWLYVQVVAGIVIWIVGDSGSVHAGASGIANGLLASLIVQQLSRKPRPLAVSVVVVAVCGFLLVFLEREKGVSVEAHLFGYVCGLIGQIALQWRQSQLDVKEHSSTAEISV